MSKPTLVFEYVNWRGKKSTRRVIPVHMTFKESQWHPGKQWILLAQDVEKDEIREFSMSTIENMRAGEELND